MNIPHRLRACAKHTGLDAVIELLQEAADEIDALQARAQVQGEPVLFIHPDTFAMNNAHVGAWKPGYELTSYIPLYTHPAQNVPDEKPLPDLMMASYHEAIGWNACRAAMLAAKDAK